MKSERTRLTYREEKHGVHFQRWHSAAPWLTGLRAPLRRGSTPPHPLHDLEGPGASAIRHQAPTPHRAAARAAASPASTHLSRSSPAPVPEAGVSGTHWASDVGRVVDAGGPPVGAVAVCGDEPVLLSVGRTAVDLVFPARLGRTFYP